MKRIVSLVLSFALLLSCVLALASCSDKPVIGIMQFGSHESLNNCYNGIVQGLRENGIDADAYEIQLLNSDFKVENAGAQANRFVNAGVDIIIAIATPSAIAAATAATGTQIPVVYCAVTDATVMENFTGVTGTSDIPDFEAQVDLIRAFFDRDDVKLGVLMSNEESSDPAQLAALQAAVAPYSAAGMQVVSENIADMSLIDSYVEKLINADVDCLVNLLDNSVVGKLDNILALTDAAAIPVFGSEIEQVKKGCLASASIEYVTVGKLAGAQAAAVLKGTPVSEVAPKTMEKETFPCYNSSVLARFPALTRPTNVEGLLDVDPNISAK